MQILPHAYQIRSCIADRHLFQYLFAGENTVLLDTGFSTTPQDVILPYLKGIGLATDRLKFAINTHADADHHGGNASLKLRCPNVLLSCGELDREVIEDPDRLFGSRYNQWMSDHGVGLGTNPEAETWVRQMTGAPQRIDVSLRGGEVIAVDESVSYAYCTCPGIVTGTWQSTMRLIVLSSSVMRYMGTVVPREREPHRCRRPTLRSWPIL